MSDSSPARESLSKTPSWVMLGFVIGCIVMWAAKEQRSPVAPAAAASAAAFKAAPSPEVAPPPKEEKVYPSLSDMEAIFDAWHAAAVWKNDITEVAYWDRTTNKYSLYVEILKNGDDYYFRTIPKLTRLLIEEGVPHDAPIKFTEPESFRAERRALYIFPPH